jgi:hypothetical protein
MALVMRMASLALGALERAVLGARRWRKSAPVPPVDAEPIDSSSEWPS